MGWHATERGGARFRGRPGRPMSGNNNTSKTRSKNTFIRSKRSRLVQPRHNRQHLRQQARLGQLPLGHQVPRRRHAVGKPHHKLASDLRAPQGRVGVGRGLAAGRAGCRKDGSGAGQAQGAGSCRTRTAACGPGGSRPGTDRKQTGCRPVLPLPPLSAARAAHSPADTPGGRAPAPPLQQQLSRARGRWSAGSGQAWGSTRRQHRRRAGRRAAASGRAAAPNRRMRAAAPPRACPVYRVLDHLGAAGRRALQPARHSWGQSPGQALATAADHSAIVDG